MEQMNELRNERKPYHAPAKMVVLGEIDETVLTKNLNGSDSGFAGNTSAS